MIMNGKLLLFYDGTENLLLPEYDKKILEKIHQTIFSRNIIKDSSDRYLRHLPILRFMVYNNDSISLDVDTGIINSFHGIISTPFVVPTVGK